MKAIYKKTTEFKDTFEFLTYGTPFIFDNVSEPRVFVKVNNENYVLFGKFEFQTISTPKAKIKQVKPDSVVDGTIIFVEV